MARKSRSGRTSTGSETRSNASGRSRRSSKSRTSRASSSRRSTQPQPQAMEITRAEDDADASLPSQKWQSACCCGGGVSCVYGLCFPCAAATARHRIDGSSWCINLLCLNICAARNIVRHGYGIKGHCCADIICSTLFAPCVACQLLGETQKRGLVRDEWAEGSGRARFEQPWKFGLFNCTDDLSTCAYGCFCPMLATASIRTQMDESDWIFNCCCLNPFIARSLVRKGYDIEGTECADFWLTMCCFPCSVCQMLNETQHRGRASGAPGYNSMGSR